MPPGTEALGRRRQRVLVKSSWGQVHVGRRNGSVFVKVRDDRVGDASVVGGSGPRGLSDRLATLGGTLTVASPPGSGTTLVAEIPLAA
jgi:signal transduction histidine kinase